MTDFGKRRFIIFLTLFLVMVTAAAFLFWREGQYCLGVEILSQKQADRYSQYRHQDCSDILTFQNELAAIDLETDTIYISQNIEQEATCRDLIGQLEISNEAYDLFFVEDPLFLDMGTAVKDAHPFQLLVTDGTSTFMRYNVVFTSLPVLCLNGDFSHLNEQGRTEQSGELCLWTPLDPETGMYSVKTSPLLWHIRGASSVTFDKKNWKLSLKTDNGDNQDLSFLGLGEDDDWILNAMFLDDTKLKEKLTMELWNTLAVKTGRKLKMSSGEYVEVLINGKYTGLYLLQRRVDAKYLDLDQYDILLKGKNTWSPATIYDAYEIIYSLQSDIDPYSLIKNGTSQGFSLETDINNFIDVNILLQLASALDNTGYKNTFYVLQKESDSYRLSMIPWDTDMSFGLWGFSYDFDTSVNSINKRMEYNRVKSTYSELDERIVNRWQDLRQNLLSEETMLSVLDQLELKLANSGAYVRDQQLWGLFHGEQDTTEQLRLFILERLRFLDSYYAAT